MTSIPSRRRISAIAEPTFISFSCRRREIARTEWSFADDRGPDQVPPLVLEVVHAAVEQEAVVPNDQRVLPPFDPAVIMEVLRQALQVIEQRAALRLAPPDEALEVGRGGEQRLAPGLGVDADRRMDALQLVLGETV